MWSAGERAHAPQQVLVGEKQKCPSGQNTFLHERCLMLT